MIALQRTRGWNVDGRRIGHYRIIQEIGAGQMGRVYLASDMRVSRRHVAIKVLPPDTIASVVARKHLRREAEALFRLNHPAVATLYEYLTEDGVDCLVMEYLPGEPLDAVVARGTVEEGLLLRYAEQLAEGLSAAHEAGVLHRDIKPANVRLAGPGRVKLIDFGLAKQLAGTQTTTGLSAEDAGGGVTGTLAYIAPELWQGAPYDARSDLYAFGVMLYELATGTRPFPGLVGSALVHAMREQAPTPARERNPKLSAGLDAMIMRLLRANAAQRYASAREVHDAIAALRAPLARTPPASRAWAVAAAALAVALLAWRAPDIVRAITRPQASAGAVVGVLPFADHSGDPGSGYVADGVTDDITARLAEFDSLQVISHATMSHVPGATAPQVARAVGASHLVQGSIRRQGDQVLFSVQLVRASDSHILWRHAYEGHADEVLILEDRIAQDVAARLHARPPVAAAPKPAAERVDPGAYDLFLRGRFALDRRDEAGIRQARADLTGSIERDSSFAPAWAALANAWSAAGFSGLEPPLTVFPQARRAAERALALDPQLADGYVSLGNILQNHDWDWPGAERAFTRAIALDPRNATAHHWYANHLALRGAFDSALVEIGRARRLEPRSLPIAVGTGAILYFARRYQQALDSLEVAVELDPNSGLVQRTRAANLDRLGREAEAVRALCAWLDGQRLQPLSEAVSGAYRAHGMPAAIGVLLAGLERKRSAGLYEPATHLAELYARTNDRGQAMRWLLLAERERDTELNRLNVDPIFDPLRSDPRFGALIGRIGFGGAFGVRSADSASAGRTM
jgi:TolB-like protein/predicted Ser/Thr protein kinase